MASVYVNNLVINAGSDFSQSFTLEASENNSALDLNGYTVESQMRKWAGGSTATSFNAEIVDPPSSGQVLVSLGSTQTTDLKPGRYVYDVLVTDPLGYKNRVIEGMVLVREGVTR